MKQDNKLNCEKSYLERIKESYRENSMLFMFYTWLNKLKEKRK